MALAGSAVLVNRRAAQAERDYLPKGRFVTVDGVRLHYVEKGTGPPVVFLHGNGAMAEDILISGLVDHAASAYRAIVFDRPGYGHSERPHHRTWAAVAQASLFAKAFAQLGLGNPIVVGHSWGTLPALALALNHPQSVGGLVLASGYYFLTPRRDVVLFSPPSMPIVGDVISYTVAPIIREAIGWPLITKMFAPQPVSPKFKREFPMALALRPSQIKAFSQDTASPRALGPMHDILAERFNTTLRLRCYYRARACSRAISSLFFLEHKSLRVANFRASWLGHGYKATQYRYSFDTIKDLGLVTWIEPETSRPSWVVVLRLVDGSYRYLSFFTREYSAYHAALTRICAAAKIRRVDPTVSSDLDRPFFSLN